MAELTITEGHIDFSAGVPQPCQTYFKKVSLPEKKTGRTLIVVPGGPTFGHNYLLPLQELARDPSVRCVIFYDHIGCGKSSRVSGKEGDGSFWSLDLLHRELSNLTQKLDQIVPDTNNSKYDMLGHSTGALLAAQFAGQNPPAGLQKLILSNGMASWELFAKSCLSLLNRYPRNVRESIIETEEHALGRRASCTVPRDDYMAAIHQFRKDHFLCNHSTLPKDFLASLNNLQDAATTFIAFAGGPVEVLWSGSLVDETAMPVLADIKAPTLVVSGEWDKAAGEICSQPFYELIPRAERVVMQGTSHSPQFEDLEGYLKVVLRFLNKDALDGSDARK